MPKYISYHGTSRRNALSIIKTGFRKGTFFAKHLEDAIEFARGSNPIIEIKEIYVFGVQFDSSTHHIPDFWDNPERWQFRSQDIISPAMIARYFSVAVTRLYANKKLCGEISRSHVQRTYDV